MKTFITSAAMLLSLFANAQLNGTYTVGGSSPDYATLNAAVNDLTSEGATGNVTFNIRPGTYTGQYALGEIPGTPGTITFRNSSNGAQAVNLEFDASGPSDNYIFQVDGTDGVFFEKLTFRPLDQVNARAIEFFNGILGLQIEQCVFLGSSLPNGSGSLDRVFVRCDQDAASTTDNPADVVIIDNSFFNGHTAIDLEFRGFGGTRSQGLTITGNEFVDQVGLGINIGNAVGVIADNSIATNVGNWYAAIRTIFFDGGSQVLRNRIVVNGTNGCEGIEVSNTQNTTGNMIANNMVYVNCTGRGWGIAVFNLWDMKILHNSVLMAGGDPSTTTAFYHLSSFPDGQDAVVRNNIFANDAGGPAYMTDVAANISTEDHNTLFTTGAVLSIIEEVGHAGLAAHQAATGMGVGDTDTDPVFPARPDLHMYGCAPDNGGLFMPEAATDIDGQTRANPACDMGADEYDAGPGVDAVQAPTITLLGSELPYALGLNASFTSYQWSTGDNTPTTTINAGGDFDCLVQDVNGCLYNISITVVVDFSTAIAPTRTSDALALYPNPAQDRVTVKGLEGVATLTISDMSGRLVQQGSITSAFSVDQLRSGTYIGVVEQRSGKRDVFRLVVE